MKQDKIITYSARWLSLKFAVMKAKDKAGTALQSIGDHFVHYLVIEDKAGRPVALVPTPEFISCFENLKKSRFAGDVDPADLTLGSLLKAIRLKEFYRVELKSGMVRVGDWVQPHDVLIQEGKEIVGIIPEEDFSEWLHQAGMTPPAPAPKPSLRN